jgi:protein-S-isoprenylcysteine O-methyltransferase Ste14
VSIIRGQSEAHLSAPAVPAPTAMTPSPAARAYAIGGALAFLASFVAGGRLFLALGRPPADAPLLPALLVNVALFGVFALHHSLLAREPVKARVVRALSPTLERPTYVWVASLLFIGMCLTWRPMAGVLYVVPQPWASLFGAIQLTGGVLTLDAARRIDVRVLSGLKLEPAAATVAPDAEPLVATGAYRFVRHPIYLGWVLLFWGTSDMTVGRLAFAAISTAYLAIAVPFEERSLRRRFGAPYEGYIRQVRWRMVPGIY